MDPKEKGTKFIDDLLMHYAEEDRPALREKLLAAEAGVVMAGENALRQEEFSKGMNENKTVRDNTEQWRRDLASYKAGVDAELEEGKAAIERLKGMGGGTGRIIPPDGGDGADPAGGGADPGGAPAGSNGGAPDLTGYTKKEDVQKLINDAVQNTQSQNFNTAAYMSNLQMSHYKEFDGEVLDTSALIAHCRESNQPVDRGGYDSFVKGKRDETQKTKHEAELKDAKDAGKAEALAELNSAPPYPVSSGSGGEDRTLAGLDPGKKGEYGVASAIKTYHEEIQKTLGTGGS